MKDFYNLPEQPQEDILGSLPRSYDTPLQDLRDQIARATEEASHSSLSRGNRTGKQFPDDWGKTLETFHQLSRSRQAGILNEMPGYFCVPALHFREGFTSAVETAAQKKGS